MVSSSPEKQPFQSIFLPDQEVYNYIYSIRQYIKWLNRSYIVH